MTRYIRDSTLLSLSPDELRLAGQVSFRDLPANGLLLFDKSASCARNGSRRTSSSSSNRSRT